MIAGEIMSRPLLALDGGCRVDEAMRFARKHGIEHVLVTEAEDVVGVVSTSTLAEAPSSDELRTHAGEVVESARATASLEELTSRLAHSPQGCVPIVAGGLLLGVVTRTDLDRAAGMQ
jgi:CBS domain-containing protein